MTPLATLGLFATIMGAIFGPSEDGWNGYIEGDYRYLAPVAGGRITQVVANEGAQVATGELLVTLDTAQEVAAVEGAQAQIAMAAANLDNLQTGSRAPEIAVIRASIDAAEAEAHLAQTDLERTKALVARSVASQAQLEQQQARLDAVTQALKVSDDLPTSQGQMAFDVFEEDPIGAALADDAGDVGPEVSGIVGTAALTGRAEGLAGIACEDGVERAAEGSGVEAAQVGPDRGRGEVTRALGGDENGARPILPFDEGAGVIAGFGEHEAQIKASAACAEGQSVPGT